MGAPMANVRFTVVRDLPLPARTVFTELINWRGHAEWVPSTRVEVLTGDGGAGTEFIATTGVGPLSLADRMRVDTLDAEAMRVEITKIGPVLTGVVNLAVIPTGAGTSRLEWLEDIEVPRIPQALAKPVGAAAKLGFNLGISRLVKLLQKRRAGAGEP